MNTVAALLDRMLTADSLACCGLDPDMRRIRDAGAAQHVSESERVDAFLREVVDIAAPHVCAFKAQKAFFDNLPDGHAILGRTIGYVHANHPDIPVFVDCKIGDIDNTMGAYVELLFEKLNADGVLVNPYMGDDVIDAFAGYPDRAIVVLTRTSNPGASIIQDAELKDGRPFWHLVLQFVVDRWNANGNLVPVISSTAGLDMAKTRALIPQGMPLLLAGIGAQGGDYSDLGALLNTDNVGVFVNSSRGLLFPPNPRALPWHDAVLDAVVSFKNALNAARRNR